MKQVTRQNKQAPGNNQTSRNKRRYGRWGWLFAFCLLALPLSAQKAGLSTNALYWATTTPNAAIEWKSAEHWSWALSMGYNAFNFPNKQTADGRDRNPKLHHWLVKPEAKYWFCSAFERGYISLYAQYLRYNAGGISFIHFLKENRYDGWGAGAGISYGYQWPLGKRWGLEASLGVGYLYLRYDKYACGSCGKPLGNEKKHYFGHSKAALSLIYYLQ